MKRREELKERLSEKVRKRTRQPFHFTPPAIPVHHPSAEDGRGEGVKEDKGEKQKYAHT